MRRRKTAVYQISDAPKRLTDDVARRQRTYMITMSVRVVLFLAAVLIPVAMVFRLLLMLGALVLPYIAVVYANGGRGPGTPSDAFYRPPGPQELGGVDARLGAARHEADATRTGDEEMTGAAEGTAGHTSGPGESAGTAPADSAGASGTE